MICLKKFTRAGLNLSLWLSLTFVPTVAHAMVFDRVAAKINNEIITLSAVEERVVLLRPKYRDSSISISEEDLLSEAVNMIVEERLQIQAGKKLGFVVDEDAVGAAVRDIENKNNLSEGQLEEMLSREGRSIKSYKDHIRDQIMVSKVTRFEMGNRLKISDKSILNYYKKHQKDFWDDTKVSVRHILFIVERGASEDIRKSKLLQAQKVLKEIRKGRDFSELAIEYSEDVSASSGGDVGVVSRGKMVAEFEDAVFKLKSGEVSDVVETEYGYHIIKADEVFPGKTLSLGDAKERVRQILTLQKQQKVYKEWIEELKKSAFIEVSLFNESSIKKYPVTKSLDRGETKGHANLNQKVKSANDKKTMQQKWEEMYKSVDKSKGSSKVGAKSKKESLEDKLKYIKKLRDRNRISESEYQERKEKLLQQL